MRLKFFLIILLRSSVSFAQQNFINVPSSEVTIKNRFFFQQQININNQTQSNTTLDFGLGKGFEIGVNLLGLNFSNNQKVIILNDSFESQPYSPLFLINILKQFQLSSTSSISVGMQLGGNIYNYRKITDANLLYLNYRKIDLLVKNSVLVIGTYYNSQHYGGDGNRLGLWMGAEVPISNKFHGMLESIAGNNAFSYTSVGIIYYPYKWMPLTLGVQIPNTCDNDYSVVFEFTLIPLHKKE